MTLGSTSSIVLIALGALALGLSTGTAFAASHLEDLTLQLKWVTQAQFAGYYVAKDKGFYESALKTQGWSYFRQDKY